MNIDLDDLKEQQIKDMNEITKNYYVSQFAMPEGDLITISEKPIKNVTYKEFDNGIYSLVEVCNDLQTAINFVNFMFSIKKELHPNELGATYTKHKIIKLYDIVSDL